MRWAVALAPWQDAAGGANPGKRAVADQLPVIVQPGTLTALSDDTYIVPALVATLGDQASWRYVEFFAANINNPHTQRAYARACSRFFAWCEQRGLTLMAIRPYDVAAWVKELQEKHGPAGVKQQLAACTDDVRLANHGPGDADESSGRRAGTEACRENR